MRKKKKDELDSSPDFVAENKIPLASTSSKVTALNEPEIKFASRPSVPIEQLKIKSSFSINEGRAYQVAAQNTAAIVEEKAEIKITNKEVSLEDIKAAILSYADAKQKEGARQLSITLSTAAVAFDNNAITLTINNESQKEQLLLVKQNFVDELRKLLQNSSLVLEIDTSKIETQLKAYKPIDIFKAMAEKNPALMELKKRFDLEIEY